MMTYRITGLPVEDFSHLVGLSDNELAGHGAVRMISTGVDRLPDRIELRDALEGESVLLVNYEHQPANSPFRSSHAVFVLEEAKAAAVFMDEVPTALRQRLLSIRAFDDAGMMIDADVVEGTAADGLIRRMLDDPEAAYLHAHYARPGCFAAKIERFR